MTLEQARGKRGWSVYAASMRMEGVSHQSLKNLECGDTDPAEVRTKTMLEIVRIYYPDVSLDDFLGHSDYPLKVVARDRRAEARLKYGS